MILKNKNIVITGGGGGIGRKIAQRCVQEKANVALIGIEEKELQNALSTIFSINSKSFYVIADVSKQESIETAFDTIYKKFKTIDVLINAAGIQAPIGPFITNKLNDWKNNIEVNLLGTINTIHYVLPRMKKQNYGKIINFSGGGATSIRPNFSAYATSKAAVVKFTETLAEELRPFNIDVNAIAPGAINTKMLTEVLKSKETAGKEYHDAVKRQKDGGDNIEKAINLIMFLSSKNSNKITGKLISAQWDPWEKEYFQNILRINKNIGNLRRIDNKYFFDQKNSEQKRFIENKKTKVTIVGCGLIGHKRALALEPDDILTACCDTNKAIVQKFAQKFHCKSYTSYKTMLDETESDIVIISVINKFAKEIALYALKQGKHILIEKPLGRNLSEAEEIINSQNKFSKLFNKNIFIKVGFNHRFHPTILKAKELINSDTIGKLLTIRARYGHGGRPGMEQEWRASKDFCGGGELLDQGVHIIDLARWFAGEIEDISGFVNTKFWNMQVEDNAFVYMKSKSNIDIQFHVSWTNWKNIFSFEIFGTDGYLNINGLGGSYGPETLEYGKRNSNGGKPIVETFSFPEEDLSWKKEWFEFKSAIQEQREPIGNSLDGLKANNIINSIYQSSKNNSILTLSNKYHEKSVSR